MAAKVRKLLPVLPTLDLGGLDQLSTLNGIATATKLRRAVGDVSVDLTMAGASVLSVPIIDPDRSILRNTALLRDRITLDLGERFGGYRRWRMYRPNRIGGFSVDGATTTLKFWDLGAAALKAETGALRKSHSMPIEALVNLVAREVAATIALTVVTPRPGETLPVENVQDGTAGDYGFSGDSAKNVNIKSRAADTEQLANINTVLQVALELKAGALSTLAMCCAGIGESAFRAVPNGEGSNYWGVFQGNKDVWEIDDTEGMARSFLKGGKGFQGGGAIKLARENPGMTAGAIATKVEGSGEDPRFYDAYHAEAVQIIEQWSGKTLALWHTVTGAANNTKKAKAAQPAEWRRGTATTAESSWAMLDRYGQTLGRRRFTAGNRLVMARDQDLILATPHQTFSPEHHALTERIAIDDNMAAGVQTIDLSVLREAWITPPGGVVAMVDAGPADGHWLVERIAASASSPTVSVTLTKEQTQIPKKDQPKPTKRGKAKPSGAFEVGDLTYPLAIHGTDLGGVAAHKARPFGNWQSDNAVDIGCPRGTAVYAVTDGIIAKLGGHWDGTGQANPNGFNVTLDGNGNSWFYTHLRYRSPSLKVGDRVKAGQYLGGSGAANGVDHLHIGSRVGDPEALLRVKDTSQLTNGPGRD